MVTPKNVLLAALLALTAIYVVFWVRHRHARPAHGASTGAPDVLRLAIGFVTDFLDTLGIGSYATTTSMFRLWKLVPDQLIPGTLNAGHTLPTVVQALVYITVIEVEFQTLLLMIVAAVGGSWIGAAIVAGLPRVQIQRGMGVALIAAAVLMVITALNLLPLGGEAQALTGPKLILALAINFILGALMTLGIGAYAPIMIMVSLLGMNPTAAFPIMMGSCAFLMPVASMQFIRKRKYDPRATLGLALGGIPGSALAALLVWSLPLDAIRWLVVVVVVYAAIALLRASVVESRAQQAA